MSLIPSSPNGLSETVSSVFDVESGEIDEFIIFNPLALSIKLSTVNKNSKLNIDTAIFALSIYEYIKALF